MNILGIHCNTKREDEEQSGYSFHDAAAVLLRDGALLGAMEEERLSRLKHANTFPVHAIEWCLQRGNITLADVDCIAINRGESHFNEITQYEWLTNNALSAPTGKQVLGDCFGRAFGVDVTNKLFFSPHHLAHAWSAFAPSGFTESLIYVADGDGDNLSGMMLVGEGDRLTVEREFSLAQSLGNLYENVIKLIGYGRFDEYKAMGLAPYGNVQTFQDVFSGCYELLPNGEYALAAPLVWAARLQPLGVLGRARRKHKPFTQEHMDVAAALQGVLEKIALHVLRHFQAATGKRHFCAAGGVFHNCTLNGKIVGAGLFDRIFIQPAAHDAGGAYGAALHAAAQLGERITEKPWSHVYFGSDIGSTTEIKDQLERWEGLVEAAEMTDPITQPARLLAAGEVIGWVQGRSEFGPRALGNRSILADPRPAANKDRINGLVKKREGFRPFAPAVLEERVTEYFDLPPGQVAFPFMLFVLPVSAAYRPILGAVTHVDGTARLQTVSRATNPRFWELLQAFEKETGVAVLLNTSFNNNAEPIVESTDDAVSCFLTTGLDALIVGNYIVRKKQRDLSHEMLDSLVLKLPPFRRLIMRRERQQDSAHYRQVFAVQGTRSRYFCSPDRPVSATMYRMLQIADSKHTVGELRCASGGCVEVAQLYEELAELWNERIVLLHSAT